LDPILYFGLVLLNQEHWAAASCTQWKSFTNSCTRSVLWNSVVDQAVRLAENLHYQMNTYKRKMAAGKQVEMEVCLP